MALLGNLFWFLFVGWWSALAWLVVGLIWCITVVGVPVGLQCFKFAGLTCMPFGKEVVYGGGSVSFLVNLLWIFLFGWEMALGYAVSGLILCITLIGIPAGIQCFKLARLAFMPFGARIL